MNMTLRELARHNSWATAQVLEYCRGLDEALLDATAPGTYGSIIGTLRHLIDSEASYLYRVNGQAPNYPWPFGEAVAVDVLAERADVLAAAWEALQAAGIDAERRCEAHGDNNEVFSVPASVLIAQAFHHANEHRAHICTILGARGLATPSVSVWDYALATGRMTLEPQAG